MKTDPPAGMRACGCPIGQPCPEDLSEEMFHHEVTVWTVGQLRAALEGVPDEARVRVFYSEEPGGSMREEQVVYAAALDDQIWYPDGRAYEPARRPEDAWFTISAEFPSGEYYRDPR